MGCLIEIKRVLLRELGVLARCKAKLSYSDADCDNDNDNDAGPDTQ